jgi:TerC family integral membrane protein
VAAACAFGGILWATAGGETGEEFFAGYLVEQSLSVDNLFVFLVLFDYFEVPLQNQDRVLNWGIYGAIVMRAIMIGLGAAALENFHPILLVFAGILVYSSAKVLLGSGDGEEEEDLSENSIVKFSQRFIESTDTYDGDKFFTIVDGIRKATPLFICMIAVEISDVVFAVDSIPAVFGVTEVRAHSYSFSTFQTLPAHTFYLVYSSESSHCLYLQYVCDYGSTEPLHNSFQSSD